MNVTKLNAVRRLTMKVHGESPGPRKHKEWRIRLYDGDRVVGYVGWVDLMQAEREFNEAIGSTVAKSDEQKEAEPRMKAYREEQAFELKVYSQQFCPAHYALQRLAGNPIADEALKDCERLRRTWETRRRNRVARDPACVTHKISEK